MKVRLDHNASAQVKGRRIQFPLTLAGAEVTLQEAPAKSATKDVWVNHAVDMGMDRAEADALTKDVLVEQLS